MKLRELTLVNFRSYAAGQFALDPNLTVVAGPNASGKTNLLEGLYVLALTKSFRAHDRELIRHGEDHFRVVARGDEMEFALGVQLTEGGVSKKVTHDKVARTLAGHVGKLPITLFEPADLALVSGPPEGRRRYLDSMLMQTHPAYVKTLQSYRRVLRQRNALLDEKNVSLIKGQIFAWDLQLAELAIEIHNRRIKLLAALNEAVPGVYGDIAGSRVDIRFTYLPSVAGDYAHEFAEQLSVNLMRDIGAGFTTIGPHREDFSTSFGDRGITAVASRGEVRTAVLAMKMAELGFIESQTGIQSLLLLDDVFSELDRSRRTYLIERLGAHQTIITTTDAEAVTREFKIPHSVLSTAITTAEAGATGNSNA